MGISLRPLLTATAALLLAVWWASRRARSRGVREHVPADLAIVLAISGLLAARLVVLAVDARTIGWAAFDVRAVVSVTAGLSGAGGLLAMLAVGAWVHRRGRLTDGAWRAIVPPVALGLAVWSLLSLVRGEAGGVRAPFPLGWSLPGAAVPRVPVGVVEALLFAGFALAVWRAERRAGADPLARMRGGRLAALLAGVAATAQLVGALLRPRVATVDGALETLLGVMVLALCAMIVLDVDRQTMRRAVAAAIVVTLGGMGLLLGTSPPAPTRTVAATTEQGLPIWSEADLAAHARAADRPVVVHLWASWCGACRAEAPLIARAAEAYADRVAFTSLSVDRDPALARAFHRRYRLPRPALAEPALRAALGVTDVPATLVVRPDGTIVERLSGLDARSLAAAIDRAA